MSNDSFAQITLYVPTTGLPNWPQILMDLPQQVRRDPAFLAVVTHGGRLVLGQDNAPWGCPWGIQPDRDFNNAIDADYDVGADPARTWNAYTGQLRAGSYQEDRANTGHKPPTYPVPDRTYEFHD
jgi:hypothetical protein